MPAGIPLLVICGPTASGKTKLAVDLAWRLDGEVVSVDSMQIYKGMDIGTAKPTPEEMAGIPHHLLDLIEPWETFSLVEFLQHAKAAIADIRSRGKLPVLAGGTGLYLHALIDNISFAEIPADPALRQALEREADHQGAEHLWRQLEQCDPQLAARLHPNNLGRVIRALEVFQSTGVPMSEWQRRSRLEPSPYEVCMLGLSFKERETLYRRIDRRVDLMMRDGLLEEVRRLKAGRLSKTAAQAIGYKELFGYLDGDGGLEAAVELIKMQSRRYAKRQMTWLRKDERIHWLEWEGFEDYSQLCQKARQIATDTLLR